MDNEISGNPSPSQGEQVSGEGPLGLNPEQMMKVQMDHHQSSPVGPPPEGEIKPEATADGKGTAPDQTPKDPGTTAPAAIGQKAAEGKGSEKTWSEDELKHINAAGMKELPYDDRFAQFVKNDLEGKRRITELSQSNSNAISQLAEFSNILQSGDVEAIVEIAKSMGGELNIDVRKPEDRLQEIAGNFDSTFNALSPVASDVLAYAQQVQAQNPEMAQVLNKVVEMFNGAILGLRGTAKGQMDEIQRKQDIRKEIASLTGQPSGSKSKSWYESLSKNAENAFTTLRQLDGAESDQYINKAKELFGEKSAFAAAGMPLAKAFGHNPQLASQVYKIGKAMHLLDNFEKVKTDLYTSWKKEHEQQISAPPRGGQARPQSAPLQGSNVNQAQAAHLAQTGFQFR